MYSDGVNRVGKKNEQINAPEKDGINSVTVFDLSDMCQYAKHQYDWCLLHFILTINKNSVRKSKTSKIKYNKET